MVNVKGFKVEFQGQRQNVSNLASNNLGQLPDKFEKSYQPEGPIIRKIDFAPTWPKGI